ncbi:hypothetical protein D6745_05490 [Candidatus Woesearchaeota archaeon]|nr:MAG: hypothetical protein D6745_05490 [Candidatus Woesearchaeota archaeon]
MLSYLLTLVFASLGLVAGIIIGMLTRDEHKTGKKYFYILKNLFFSLILVVFLGATYWSVILGILLFIVLFRLKFDELFAYLFLAVLFSFYRSENYLLPTLIFIYGIPAGTLLLIRKKPREIANKAILTILGFIALGYFLFLFL